MSEQSVRMSFTKDIPEFMMLSRDTAHVDRSCGLKWCQGLSPFRGSEHDTAQYPINQWIVADELAVSQDCQATDVQQSYIECDKMGFS